MLILYYVDIYILNGRMLFIMRKNVESSRNLAVDDMNVYLFRKN